MYKFLSKKGRQSTSNHLRIKQHSYHTKTHLNNSIHLNGCIYSLYKSTANINYNSHYTVI